MFNQQELVDLPQPCGHIIGLLVHKDFIRVLYSGEEWHQLPSNSASISVRRNNCLQIPYGIVTSYPENKVVPKLHAVKWSDKVHCDSLEGLLMRGIIFAFAECYDWLC